MMSFLSNYALGLGETFETNLSICKRISLIYILHSKISKLCIGNGVNVSLFTFMSNKTSRGKNWKKILCSFGYKLM